MARPSLDPAILHGLETQAALDGVREEWLMQAVTLCHDIFSAEGFALPPVRVSCSFPGGGSSLRRIGECWPRSLSTAGVNEIYISPYLDDPVQVLDVLVHELVHAVDDCKSKHGKEFKRIATAVGLEGRATRASAGENLRQQLTFMAEALGEYPHRKMTPHRKAKRARKSSPKWECDQCGCVFSLSHAMYERFSVERCPSCGHLDPTPAG